MIRRVGDMEMLLIEKIIEMIRKLYTTEIDDDEIIYMIDEIVYEDYE